MRERGPRGNWNAGRNRWVDKMGDNQQAETTAETRADQSNPPVPEVEEAEAKESETKAKEQFDDLAYPWSGPARPADWTCLSLMSLSGITAMVSMPFKAMLIGTNPVLLALLTGSNAAIVAGAAFAEVGRAWLPLVLIAGVIGKIFRDPLMWWAGRLWGPRAMDFLSGRSPRAAKALVVVERFVGRHKWLALVIGSVPFVPSALIYAMLGWSGMRLWTFVLLDAVVAAFWVSMWMWLGITLGQTAVDVANEIGKYSIAIALVLVAVIIVRQILATRRSLAAQR